jgi:WD40 repeat protein
VKVSQRRQPPIKSRKIQSEPLTQPKWHRPPVKSVWQINLCGNGDGTISVWDIATRKEIRNWKAHENTVFKLVITFVHRCLESIGDTSVKLWDTNSWREIQPISIPKLPDPLPSRMRCNQSQWKINRSQER